MNKSFLKFITDFGPLIIFFYYYYDSSKNLKVAIPPFIIATILALAFTWILEKKNTKDSIVKRNFNNTIWWFNYLFQQPSFHLYKTNNYKYFVWAWTNIWQIFH